MLLFHSEGTSVHRRAKAMPAQLPIDDRLLTHAEAADVPSISPSSLYSKEFCAQIGLSRIKLGSWSVSAPRMCSSCSGGRRAKDPSHDGPAPEGAEAALPMRLARPGARHAHPVDLPRGRAGDDVLLLALPAGRAPLG